MNASALQNFSHRNGPEILALADDLVRVRNQFNTLLGKVSTAAQARAKELGNAYLTKLLGQQVPGPVTLQVGNRHQATFIVTQLTSVQEASDGISGIVATVDASGTHHDSHHFYMKDGTAHFSEPDIY